MTAATGALLFDTELGECGIAWSERGIVGVNLPETQPGQTLERLRRRHGLRESGHPPPAVQQAVLGIVGLLRGERIEFHDAPLDLEGVPAMHQRVYAIARAIPPGATCTYGEIAARLGDSQLARAVGQALARNPIPIIVPCHRVLAAGGRSGGFSGGLGVSTKLRLLAIEGAALEAQHDLFSDGNVHQHQADTPH